MSSDRHTIMDFSAFVFRLEETGQHGEEGPEGILTLKKLLSEQVGSY